jgi:hypothetical protein
LAILDTQRLQATRRHCPSLQPGAKQLKCANLSDLAVQPSQPEFCFFTCSNDAVIRCWDDRVEAPVLVIEGVLLLLFSCSLPVLFLFSSCFLLDPRVIIISLDIFGFVESML